MHHQSTDTRTSPLWTALRWLSAIIAVGIVTLAAVIGQGIWGGEGAGFITGHGHLGNAVFALAAIQFVLAVLLYQKKQISALHMVLTFALLVLLLAQAGLGYSGRSDKSLIAWHVPNGVLLMGIAAWNSAMAWMAPRPARTLAR